jgi:hypothetical protein
MVHPIKSLSLLGDVLTATTNEQFNLIVANRVESQSIDEKQKKYQDFMVTMRGLLELMGHDFPETIVTATMTLQEQFNLWGEYNKQITQTISAIGGMTKAQDERAKREEIASANSIQNEAKRQSTIDAIDVKYDKKQQDRSKKMKIWKQASALSNTALSATQVLADETIKPSWLKFPIAGLMIAQGLAQVATIEAQAFAKGGDFVTNKPEMIMVGEAGREHVKITPIDRPESRALKDGGLTINVSAPLVDETILDTIIPAIEKAHRMNLA